MAAAASAAAAVAAVAAVEGSDMAKGTWIALGVVGAILLVVLGVVASGIGTYNSLTTQSVDVDAQSKQVDVAYQRAFRLVPQIVNLSETYVDKTSEAYARVIALRTQVANAQNGTLAERDAAAAQVGPTFNFMVEAYPEIRTEAIYQTVIDEVINTENIIRVEKTRYNDYVRDYNSYRRQCCLPLLVAGMFDFDEREYIGFNDRPNTGSFGNNTL